MALTRESCCICEVQELREVLTISQMPVYMGTTESRRADDDVLVDQVWVQCGSCGVVQLKHLGDLNLVYLQNHHQVEVGRTWNRHHSMFADFILCEEGDSILEFGAGAGYLASRVLSRSNVRYRVVEPKPGIFPEAVEVIEGFIEDNYDLIRTADTVVHSHLIEHVYFPRDFLQKSSKVMRLGAKLFMSVPNFEGLLESPGSVNVLNFEHTYFLHRRHLEKLLEFYGLKVDRISLFEKHSFFVAATKVREADLGSDLQLDRLDGWGDRFAALWMEVENFASTFAKRASGFGGKKYLFGAHVFSQAFLNKAPLGLQIDGVLDNDPTKQGTRLYGSSLEVFPPMALEETDEEVMVALMASHYQDEIRDQLLTIRPDIQIIEPSRLPTQASRV